MNITLRAGEKIYLNGAVIRADRRVSIELLNDVTFLLEAHVLQADEATTPLRQIYFTLQVALMDPAGSGSALLMAKSLLATSIEAFRTPEIVAELHLIRDLVTRGRHFDALKSLRALYPMEAREMRTSGQNGRSNAA